MTVRCVAFDLDDTLYLERDYVRSGFWAVGRWIESHVAVTDFDAGPQRHCSSRGGGATLSIECWRPRGV